ncbi:hypothetical protein MMC18_004347 [Xylographa bjoerkii]|nr:hypothetical protein [Xylographa bjoerkii]
MITKFRDRRPAILKYEGDSLPYPEELEKPMYVDWAFYAIPGCGKTRLIEILLSRHWGLFFITGSLPVTEGSTKRSLASDINIYNPRREGYSKDLHYLWRTVNSYFRMFPDQNAHHLRSMWRYTFWKEILICSRILVFGQFLSNCPNAKPADWLELQRDYDPFSPLFWLLTLQVTSFSQAFECYQDAHISPLMPERLDVIMRKMRDENVENLFIVLDEAQHDLDAKFYWETNPAIPGSSQSYENTMIQLFNEMRSSIKLLLSTGFLQVPVIYSGTSLRLDEMTAYLKTQVPDFKPKFKVHSDFLLLRSNNEFECLLDDRKYDPEKELDLG